MFKTTSHNKKVHHNLQKSVTEKSRIFKGWPWISWIMSFDYDLWPYPLTMTFGQDLWPWPLTMTFDNDLWLWPLTLSFIFWRWHITPYFSVNRINYFSINLLLFNNYFSREWYITSVSWADNFTLRKVPTSVLVSWFFI